MDEISRKYQKKTQREHLLSRPGMYMGSIYDTLDEVWILDSNKMVKRNLLYNPGILKLFDEIIMNSTDHARDNPEVTQIKVSVKDNIISVSNNGPGIPIVKHSEHNIYIPELIFSQFLTSTNYDDNEKRLKAGMNGLGAKVTSTFSSFFEIETVSNGKKYIQQFKNNLQDILEPKITSTKEKDRTKITFIPDYQRFKTTCISDSTLKLLEKRTYDVAACTSSKVSVFFNDVKLTVKEFKDYTNLFITDENILKEKIIFENERWKIAICTSPYEEFTQVSFVNGVHTINGGTHVNYILNPIVKRLSDKLSVKDIQVKSQYVKENIMIFVFALIENPEFKSQAKEELTTKTHLFGSTCVLDENILKKIDKMELVTKIKDIIKFKESKALNSTDGKKKTKLIGIPKLDDAEWAGSRRSQECTLILTEGDSAKTFAVSGRTLIGDEKYGIFPLRGKLLNVKTATASQLIKNEEIKNLKQILGLQNGRNFKTLDELKKTMRYGRILILTDADTDGSHIKGLLINFFHTFWKLLIEDDNFITVLNTPIVKAFKGNKVMTFYNINEYNNWKSCNNNWKIKYYKGLGTSTAKEARECFEDFEKKQLFFQGKTKKDTDAIILAFKKDLSNERKEWIKEHSGKDACEASIVKRPTNENKKVINISDFFNKEFVQFSICDCKRSIPNIMDGFKPSQRKVFYGILKKNTNEEIKIDQLRGFIAEKTAYHHGDTSLNETIISMNYDFVGSNNINLLIPCGMLGTRLEGGKDAASPRYISTKLNPITRKIFVPDDDYLLKYLDDDGYFIEPEYYLPIIPMILVNGSSGIGTGYSTDIPCYNPKEIIDIILKLLENENYNYTLNPWYKNFKGQIVNVGDSYSSIGRCKRKDRTTLVIDELPIGTWTHKYEEFLDKLIETEVIDHVKNKKTETIVNFEVVCNNRSQIESWISKKEIHKVFKLKSTIKCNLTLFDENGKIVIFMSVQEIIKHFFDVRLRYYNQRRLYLLKKYKSIIDKLQSKVLFIQKVISGDLKVFKIPKKDVEDQLTHHNFPKIIDSYDYLLDLKIHQFTEEKIIQLENDLNDILEKFKALENKSPKDLWKDDLIELKNALDE
jgi:DNA topoisomerase II